MTDLTVQSHSAATVTGTSPDAPSGADFGTFLDTVLDIVNPLQHLPIVSTLYRSLTGDTISAPARLVGDALYGGPIGAAAAVVNLIVEQETGSDIGEHALALVTDQSADSGLQLAMIDGVVPTTVGGTPTPDLDGGVSTLLADTTTAEDSNPPAGAGASTVAQIASAAGSPDTATIAMSTATPTPASSPALLRSADTVRNAPRRAAADMQPPPAAMPARTKVTASGTKVPPAWFTAALAAAGHNGKSDHDEGETAAGPSPESIAAEMAIALDKYQAMAIARGSETAARPVKAGAVGTAN